VMKKLASEGMTMVVVTHEMGFAPRGRRPDRLHGRRGDRGERQATRGVEQSPARADERRFLSKVM